MSCYGCGSANGSTFKLCPACLAERKLQHAQTKQNVLQLHRGDESDPFLKFMSSTVAKLIAAGVLVTAIFGYLLLQGPVAEFGMLATAIFAAMVSCYLISVLTWALFWMRALVHDIFWAIACTIIPCLVYRYVILRWQEREVRAYFIVHLLSLLLSGVLTFALSVQLQAPPLEVFKLYSFYINGKKPVFSAATGEVSVEPEPEEEYDYER